MSDQFDKAVRALKIEHLVQTRRVPLRKAFAINIFLQEHDGKYEWDDLSHGDPRLDELVTYKFVTLNDVLTELFLLIQRVEKRLDNNKNRPAPAQPVEEAGNG